MNGELAQIIFLVSYGNAYLSKGAAQEVDVASNSTFKYLSSLSFSRYKSDQFTDGELVAKSVAEWFAFLRSCQRISFMEYFIDMAQAGYP